MLCKQKERVGLINHMDRKRQHTEENNGWNGTVNFQRLLLPKIYLTDLQVYEYYFQATKARIQWHTVIYSSEI